MMTAVPVPKETAIAVEYPGYVENTVAALDTLGGVAGIAKAHIRNSDVAVSCRPGDKLAHAIQARRQPRNALLLRLSKPAGDAVQPQTVQAEAVARVTVTYRFDRMADFQYAGDAGPAAHAQYPAFEGPFGIEREPLTIPPPVFSRHSHPQDYSFKSAAQPAAAAQLRPAGSSAAAARRPANVVAQPAGPASPAQQPANTAPGHVPGGTSEPAPATVPALVPGPAGPPAAAPTAAASAPAASGRPGGSGATPESLPVDQD